MSAKRRSSRRARRSPMGRILLALILIPLALSIASRLLFQEPEQKPNSNDLSAVNRDESLDSEDAASEEALRSHRERKRDFYTILLSGVDDHNGGSDTNILVAVDVANDQIYGVSIPRDAKAIVGGKAHKINYAYNSGGIALLAETVTEQLGIPVDYTVQVDLQGFVALVDAIGGVEFDVPMDMNYEDPYQNLYIHIPKGRQNLSGQEALQVVRFREGYASQDLGRMETQQRFLKAVAQKLFSLSALADVDKYIKIFNAYVETDLTLGNLAWLGRETLSMGVDAIEFSTLPNSWKSPYIYLDPDATLALVNAHLNPYVEDRVPEDLHIPS